MSRRRVPSRSDVWDALVEQGEQSHFYLLLRPRLRRFPAASRTLTHICQGGGGCSFSETVVVTFSLCRPFPHMFYFFIRLLKITRASSHIFVLICPSSVLSAGRVKEISSVFIHALHVFFFTRNVLSVTESTFFKQIVSFKSLVFSLCFINWHCCFSTISRFVTPKRK